MPSGEVAFQTTTASITNTVIAGNSSQQPAAGPDCSGTISSGDYNLIQDTTACGLSGTHNITGQDAQLGPLQDNGGPTPTLALLLGSPAIDAGDNARCAATDQRGVDRPRDGDGNGSFVCDIGAFEAAGPLSPPARCGDGVIETGEQCDDGNTANGDCCSSTCQLAPNGTACTDHNFCTGPDACQDGVCTGACRVGRACGRVCGGNLQCAQDGSACACMLLP